MAAGMFPDCQASHSPAHHATGTFDSGSPSTSGRYRRPSWFDFPLLEERQLVPEEEILRGEGDVGTGREENDPTQLKQDRGCREETVPDSQDQDEQDGYERSGSHVTRRYDSVIWALDGVLAENRAAADASSRMLLARVRADYARFLRSHRLHRAAYKSL